MSYRWTKKNNLHKDKSGGKMSISNPKVKSHNPTKADKKRCLVKQGNPNQEKVPKFAVTKHGQKDINEEFHNLLN